MSKQLAIYDHAFPINAARHGDASVEAVKDFAFSRQLSTVPLMAAEIPAAAGEYAIVFIGKGEQIMPAVILGLNAKENRYIDEHGVWQAAYVPAFIRRYPFVFTSPDSKSYYLCIDEAYAGFNREGRGQRLFGEDGQPTPYVQNVLKFLETCQIELKRSQLFCKKLQELGLFEPMQAKLRLDGGEVVSLIGFMGINRRKLASLPDETLASMAKTGQMELIYSHLHSLRNLTGIKSRKAQPPVDAPEAADVQAMHAAGGTAVH